MNSAMVVRITTGTALAATLFVLAIGLSGATAAQAGSKYANTSQHPQSERYRGRAEVRGFRLRIGGYSYSYQDSLIQGDGSIYRGSPVYQGGPFDSGYFFDSGIGPRGGRSPYMN